MKYSTSSLSTSFNCMALWNYTYNHNLEPIDSDSFEANYGRSFHGLVEGNEEPISHFGPKWQQIIRSQYEGYTKYWSNRTDSWGLDYHAHEISFEFKLTDEYVLHGIVDGVAKYTGKTRGGLIHGKNYLVETKTTGSNFPEYMQYREQALQSCVYLLAAQLSPELQQYDIQGIIYDVVKRPTIRKKRSESDNEYIARCADWFYDNREQIFNRKLITKSQDYLDDAAADIMLQIDAINEQRWVKNRDNCYKFRRQCGFYETCFGEEKLSNNELYQVRKKR